MSRRFYSPCLEVAGIVLVYISLFYISLLELSFLVTPVQEAKKHSLTVQPGRRNRFGEHLASLYHSLFP